MSIPVLALLIIAAVVVGWILAQVFPEAPLGTDPEFWRAIMRRKRRQMLRRLAGRHQ